MTEDTARTAAASLLRKGGLDDATAAETSVAETPASAAASQVADAAASLDSLTVQAESVAELLSSQGGMAQAFQDMARGEVAMQKLERELSQFEARLEQLLAAVSGDQDEEQPEQPNAAVENHVHSNDGGPASTATEK